MEYSITTLETLKLNNKHLDAAIKEEDEGYVWKNLIRIEKLKRQKLREKNTVLRSRIQCSNKPI